VEVPYRDLGKRFMHVSYVPEFAEDGTVGSWLSAVADLTERRRIEDALRESEAALRTAQVQLQAHATELERKVEERTASLRAAIGQMEEFSYSVSHDLRSPLRAMQAYAEALVEDYGPQLDATARGYLERIQRSSVRMEKLTHDVLSYSRVAREEVQLAPVDLERLIADLISQYAELQPAAADVEIHRPLLPVLAHEPSLGQCLGNLLTNAAKFVRPGERPRIRVRTEPRGARVRIWVEDEGIGIPPQYHGALFQVFERLPTPMSYEGTGIGLAIVRKAAEKMGGTCGVESDGRQGSRFWVELSKG
jgi:signal transduction histidine kinase